MPATKLIDYLQAEGVNYTGLTHPEAYSAHDVALAAHVPERQLAKTVIIKVDGDLAMAVLPASRDVDLETLEAVLEADRVRLSSEAEFRKRFPDCDTGAMPPFGNLYGLSVYVDESLARAGEIVFEAGSHHEAIRMAYADFERLVHPRVLRFSAAHVHQSAERSSHSHLL